MESVPFTKGPTNRGARGSMFFALPPLFGPLRKHASPTFRSTPTPLTKVHSGKVGRFSFDSAVSENTTDYRINRMGTTARATGTNKKKGGVLMG